ncbi:hypothetical protein KUCAC02_009647 [Chaenocephalus aceratus]|nr:hypothetical protein KUCAC02_009647 [Chaenocephalus aceratus]
MEDPGSPPAAGTVRRVDVLPPACRPPHYMLQPLQPLPLHPHSPAPAPTSCPWLGFRSVSAPGSECTGEEEEEVEEEEEEAGNAAARVPYGVSVIEKNARVIKWLYGLRQAKDTKSTNL